MMQIAMWEIGVLAAVVLSAAAWTGAAFWLAGNQYKAKQKQDDLDARQSRKDTADVYKTMQATIGELSGRLNAVEDAGARARDRIRELEQGMAQMTRQLAETMAGVDILIEQLDEAKIVPAWKPKDAEMVSVAVSLPTLAQQIHAAFSLEEIADLALQLDIDPEDVTGTTRQRRASALVEAAQRRGLVGQLILICKELRPNRRW